MSEPQQKNLHRNNAAEWVMFIVVWPVAWVVRLFHHGGTEGTEKRRQI